MHRIGSLFTGYGGLDLATAAHYNATVVWHAEIEPAACRLLEQRWPGTPNLGDIARSVRGYHRHTAKQAVAARRVQRPAAASQSAA